VPNTPACKSALVAAVFSDWRFETGARVRKIKGSSWQGHVVGFYSTELTPEGYCVESEREPGSVQIYPVSALELVEEADHD
jgi:hypothetical protein